MYRKKDLLNVLDHLIEEIANLKANLLKPESRNLKDSQKAWDDLVKVSEEMSEKWDGISAVEEIKKQREKSW